jgi:hypothetical protein
LREYFSKNSAAAKIGLIASIFSANKYRGQFSVFSTEKSRADSRRYTNGSMTVPKRQWNSKAVATAERRRRAFQFYLAGFTQEEIAEKVGVDRSVISRDLAVGPRGSLPRGVPRCSRGVLHPMERMKFKGTRIGVRPNAPAVGRKVQPRGGGGILESRVYNTIVDRYCTQLKL